MALLSGIGLMTINNIGNSVKALWLYYDDSATDTFIQHRQVLHVFILSFGNFLGRLFSGIGLDLLVRNSACPLLVSLHLSRRLHPDPASRYINLKPEQSGRRLWYDRYRLRLPLRRLPFPHCSHVRYRGLSQNWGVMTLAPVFSVTSLTSYTGAFTMAIPWSGRTVIGNVLMVGLLPLGIFHDFRLGCLRYRRLSLEYLPRTFDS